MFICMFDMYNKHVSCVFLQVYGAHPSCVAESLVAPQQDFTSFSHTTPVLQTVARSSEQRSSEAGNISEVLSPAPWFV